jgi:hypothetical protein
MESLDTGRGHAKADDQARGFSSRPAPRLGSTKGGAGATAGATPKKAYRPSRSSKARPAGKKPDSGPR